MKKIGIIDIGSNSVRLVLVEIKENHFFHILEEVKESVRLGQGINKDGNLIKSKMEHGIQTLKEFKYLCDVYEVEEIIAVATEAVRRAGNQQEFIKRVKEETGIDVKVLTGEKEAHYGYLGTLYSMDLQDSLIMDIGGCSTELILVHNQKKIKSISLPFGAINLSQQFTIQDKMSAEQEEKLKKFINQFLEQVPWLKEIQYKTLIGVGGTFRNLGKIDRKRKNYPLDLTHNYDMKSQDIFEIYNVVKQKNLAQRKKIKGLSSDRADIIVGASAVISSVVEYCNIKEVKISGYGIRDGLLYDYLKTKGAVTENVLDFSIRNILKIHNLQEVHSHHVFELTKMLYDGLKEEFHLDKDIEKILKVASMLHKSGLKIRYYDYHKHSFYMILHSRINGISQKEILMAAYTAYYHRKTSAKIDFEHYKKMLSSEDQETIKKLGVLLRIATALDMSMNGIIESVQCVKTEDAIILKTISKFDASLEINTALKAQEAFKKIYMKNLMIV